MWKNQWPESAQELETAGDIDGDTDGRRYRKKHPPFFCGPETSFPRLPEPPEIAKW